MVSEIKFGAINTNLKQSDIIQKEVSQTSNAKNKDVTLSSNLESIVNSYISEESDVNEQTRVMNMKQQIESNHYIVDTDVLAEKLYQNLFSSRIGG